MCAQRLVRGLDLVLDARTDGLDEAGRFVRKIGAAEEDDADRAGTSMPISERRVRKFAPSSTPQATSVLKGAMPGSRRRDLSSPTKRAA